MINNAQWTFLASEPQKGTVTFTAYGIAPIDSDGTLFKLNMKILSGASGSVTSIACSPSDFKGNNTTGEFQTNAGTIYYSAPAGPIQSKGDVNLDMVVDMNDFYALLNHLNGTVPLNDPQALLNADFNSDGIIDVADLNDLYNFINGITPSPKIASGSLTIQNVSYGPGGDALIPFAVCSGSGISSISLTFNYDPQKISYKAFKPSIEGFGNLSYASEVKPGEARYIFTSIHSYEGNFDAGAVLLNFVKGSLPKGAVVYTSYSINGQEVRKGPAFTFTTNGVNAVASKDNSMPREYSLSQNYPNPFNPSTVIKYSLPLSGPVRLKIFNILGREVKTLVNGYMSQGNYSVTWYGDDNAGVKVSSGTYIYRIVSDGFIQTKKMIFIK